MSSQIFSEGSKIYLIIGTVWALTISILIPLEYGGTILAMVVSGLINGFLTLIIVFSLDTDTTSKLNSFGYDSAGTKIMGRIGIIVYAFVTVFLTRQISIWMG